MRNVIKKVAIAASLALGLQLSAQAATALGELDAPSTATFTTVTANGTFLELYNFTVSSPVNGGFSADTVSFLTYGAKVDSLSLYEGTFATAGDLSGHSVISASTVTTVNGSSDAIITTLASSAALSPTTTYTLAIGGSSIDSAGFTGIVAIHAIPVLPPVPEPETYAMLLAGLGMMGFIARRRQKNR